MSTSYLTWPRWACLLIVYCPLLASTEIVHPGNREACSLCALRAEMDELRAPALYYVSVMDPESRKIRVIQTESKADGPAAKTYADAGGMTLKNWRLASQEANKPGAESAKEKLKKETMQNALPRGEKPVFIEDRTGEGVTPEVFGLLNVGKKTGSLRNTLKEVSPE
jgi:hypothetical protein